jgi:hypothetical protein
MQGLWRLWAFKQFGSSALMCHWRTGSAPIQAVRPAWRWGPSATRIGLFCYAPVVIDIPAAAGAKSRASMRFQGGVGAMDSIRMHILLSGSGIWATSKGAV